MTADERTKKAIKQLEHMIDRLTSAGPGYTTDVIALHGLEDWLVQITIKATRARYSVSSSKLRDELIDTANYCALALSLLDDATQPSVEHAPVIGTDSDISMLSDHVTSLQPISPKKRTALTGTSSTIIVKGDELNG
jgi:hypothetical protein